MTEWKWIKITNSSVFSLLFNQLSTKFGISCFSLMRNKEISEFFYLMIRGEKTHFKKNQIVFRISSQFNSEAKKQKQTFFFHFLHDKVNFQHNLSLSVHFKQEEYLSIIISQIKQWNFQTKIQLMTNCVSDFNSIHNYTLVYWSIHI